MIGFIGGGNMAEAMIKGITRSGKKDILVSELRDERRAYLESTYTVKTTPDNKEVVKSCDIIILAVKPQNMDDVPGETAGRPRLYVVRRPAAQLEILGFEVDLGHLRAALLERAARTPTKLEMDVDIVARASAGNAEGAVAVLRDLSPLVPAWRVSIQPRDPGIVSRYVSRQRWIYGTTLVLLVAGMVLGVVLVVRDLSRERRLSQLRADFVANVTHELKTPLTSIRMSPKRCSSGGLRANPSGRSPSMSLSVRPSASPGSSTPGAEARAHEFDVVILLFFRILGRGEDVAQVAVEIIDLAVERVVFEAHAFHAFEELVGELLADPLDLDAGRYIVWRESPTEIAEYYLVDGSTPTPLTKNEDVTPDLTRAPKDRFIVERPDGFKFRVSVTLPPGYQKGTRLPAIFWFYPREFATQEDYDRGIRTYNRNEAPNFGTRSMHFFVRLGYAVVEPDAPIVGPTGRMNDNYEHDLRNNLAAVIDELRGTGGWPVTRLRRRPSDAFRFCCL